MEKNKKFNLETVETLPKHPPDWRWVRLGEVCEIIMGQSPPGSTYTDKPEGLPFFQGKADFGEYFPTVRVWCTQPIKISEEGDILISVRAPVGPVNMNNLKCCIGRGLTAIRCKNNAINSFIFCYLRSIEAQIASLGSGSTFGAITRDDLISLQIPLPPIEEQKHIATKIQDLMQEVERARIACEKQLEAAKALPVAYLREVFQSEEAKKWERKRLGETAEEFVNGGTPDTSVPHYWNGNIPWITGADITSLWVSGGRKFTTDEGLNNSATHLVKKNTVLIVTRTGVGKVGIAANDLCFSQDITGVICSEKIVPEFLVRLLLFQGDTLIRIQRGATIKGLTRDDIESLEVPLPPLPIQHRIVSYLKEKMAEVEKLRTSIEKQLEAINALPQAILRKTFRGEL